MADLRNKIRAVALSLGVFASYSSLAFFKEQLFKNEFGDEKFVYPIALGAVLCVSNAIIAKGLKIKKPIIISDVLLSVFYFPALILILKHPQNEIPQKFYAVTSIFDTLAIVFTNMSLQFVPYVILIVGKCESVK